MLNKKDIMQEIENNRERIRAFGVAKLTLFGSYACEKQKKNSDIDFLVEFKPGRGLIDDYVHLLQFLEDIFHKKIDLGEEHLLRQELKEPILGGIKLEAKI